MKRFLSRFWLPLLIAGLVAWPIVIISLIRVQPLDEPTLERLQTLLRQKTTAGLTIAPPLPLISTKNFPSVAGHSDIADAPAFDTELTAAEEELRPWIEYFEKLPADAALTSQLNFQDLAKVQRALAMRAVRKLDWPEALHRLRSTADIGNSFRDQTIIGMVIATAIRALAYGGYEKLLHADAPVGVYEDALRQLQSLRATDQQLNNRVLQSETLQQLQTREQIKNRISAKTAGPLRRREDPFPASFYLASAGRRLCELASSRPGYFTDGRLQEWAVDHAGWQVHPFLKNLQWSEIPAAERWLKEVIAREPRFYKVYGLTDEEYQGLDPWTLALLNPENGVNLLEVRTRYRMEAARGRLLEAAFAARVHQMRTGRWPDEATLQQLIAPPPPEWMRESIRIAMQPVDGELKMALWSSALPLFRPGSWTDERALREGGEMIVDYPMNLNYHFEQRAKWEFLNAQATRQTLEAHPSLVESVRLNASLRRQTMDIRSIEDLEELKVSSPPTPPPMPGYGYSGHPGYGYGQRSSFAGASLRLQAQLRAPESAWVVWWPGPDGIDDGGRIQYDPTNGTVSRGDLIVFPEKTR